MARREDAERLDGANGLLLSPHIDHLFDEGYITFSANQALIIVPEVREKLLDAWGIDSAFASATFQGTRTRTSNTIGRMCSRNSFWKGESAVVGVVGLSDGVMPPSVSGCWPVA